MANFSCGSPCLRSYGLSRNDDVVMVTRAGEWRVSGWVSHAVAYCINASRGLSSTAELLVCLGFIVRPSSLGGGRILRRTLSVCPSVPL